MVQKNAAGMRHKIHRGFPVSFANFLRTPLFIEHLLWLLLKFIQTFFIQKKKRSGGHNYFTIHVNKKSAQRVTKSRNYYNITMMKNIFSNAYFRF